MLIKHFFPGSTICIMKHPSSSRLCFEELRQPVPALQRVRSRGRATRFPAPGGKRRPAAAPRKPWDGFTDDETFSCFSMYRGSLRSCPVSRDRSFAQGQPRGRGTFLFSCSRWTRELVL